MNYSFVACLFNRIFCAIRPLIFIALTTSTCHEGNDAQKKSYCEEIVSQYEIGETIPPIGQSASSFLQLGEPKQGKLTWTGDSPVLTIHPKQGESELKISIEENPLGHARFIHSEKVGDGRIHCPNRVELDTLLRLQTSDGGLVDTWHMVAQGNPDEPLAGLSIESNIIDTIFQGSFSMHVNEAESTNWDLKFLWMVVHWHSTKAKGQILFEARNKFKDDPNEPDITGGVIFRHVIANFEASAP